MQVSARNAVRTPQFWCLWIVLCMNVTAGIGILEKAAPMITDFFADTSTPVSASAAAGFVALLSAANMAGRIVLVVDVRPDRPQEHLPRLPGRRAR